MACPVFFATPFAIEWFLLESTLIWEPLVKRKADPVRLHLGAEWKGTSSK